MIMKLTGLSLCTVAMAAVGCITTATSHHRGTVAMKMTDTEAHVGLGIDEVNEGDDVELFKNICTDSAGGSGDRMKGGTTLRSCRKEKAGHGTVAKVLGADYSIVKFPEGTKFSEGDVVEKHIHR